VNPMTDKPSLVGRALRLVTKVQDDEIPLALVLSLNVFLLLTAYYVIKPVREALILALSSGAEYKSYMSALIALTLLLAVPAYAKLVDRLPRLKLVVGVTLFFASHLVFFYFATQSAALRPILGLVFYVWVGVFNMMVVAQLWSFATDLYDPERGKRLFPLVALGASLGAALGSKIAGLLVEPLGISAMLLVSAGLLVACAWLFVEAERLATASRGALPAGVEKAPEPTPAAERGGAFQLVFRHRYVALIAVLTAVYNFANSNGEYMLGKVVKSSALAAVAAGSLAPHDVGAFIGKSYADFFFAVNVVGVLLQAFVVSRIVRYGGLGVALLVLPVIALSNGLAVLAWPLLSVIRAGKTLENATDYSLNNTVRQMLWLPLSPALKYKAKQAVDTFFVRLGDVSSALLVALGSQVFAWSVRGFALANAVLGVVWLGLGAAIIVEHQKLASRGPRSSTAPDAPLSEVHEGASAA
jgi:AAA family ATP:ADP antiporter